MNIEIPEYALVALIGPSGAGKSTFARRHFLPTEILSSDGCRGLVGDDENDQSLTPQAFELLHFLAGQRLALGKLVVVDATSVQPEARRSLVHVAREHHCLPVAVVFDIPEKICAERNRARPDRTFGVRVIRQQRSQMRGSLKRLQREGFRRVYVFRTPEEVEAAAVSRVPLWCNLKNERGPFDLIGDVHGCCDELLELLALLGYQAGPPADAGPLAGPVYFHPQGRKAVFLGDLVDRGPRILDSLQLARNMVLGGTALAVPGNHDMKLLRKLRGRPVQVKHGLAQTLAEIEALPLEPAARIAYCEEVAAFLDSLVSHYVLDEGRLVVAHAGMKEAMQGRGSSAVRDFALYGETNGEVDEFGLPVRCNWAAEYRGRALVVYGHTPVREPEFFNGTVNIDTGCVFGGRLTALRYPEREFVSVPARRAYCETARPFLTVEAEEPSLSAQQEHDHLLDAEDVLGKRIIATRLRGNITLREENAAAALEVMSRFAIDPKWLIHLPPTMSPCETSTLEGYLEYPTEAFAYYRAQGCPRVVCQEKHMGSRAIVVVCREERAARARFGVEPGELGVVYTRTGRRFFTEPELERALLERLIAAATAGGLWEELQTEWLCLDCELMPWSAKARELLRSQYAAVGAAGRAALGEVEGRLRSTAGRLAAGEAEKAGMALAAVESRAENVERFIAAYRRYCWQVESLDDLKLAPFHLLASEGAVHAERDHAWHMEMLARVCAADALFRATPHRFVDLASPAEEQAATEWWLELTAAGGEGMVVKPIDFLCRGPEGLAQPAVKCRGREYLRIIYGPDYDTPKNLERLRRRRLGHKRSLALREFALGIESLERFTRREPLRRTHECVFAVLALESEPVDPRL